MIEYYTYFLLLLLPVFVNKGQESPHLYDNIQLQDNKVDSLFARL